MMPPTSAQSCSPASLSSSDGASAVVVVVALPGSGIVRPAEVGGVGGPGVVVLVAVVGIVAGVGVGAGVGAGVGDGVGARVTGVGIGVMGNGVGAPVHVRGWQLHFAITVWQF
jgi:hypothetical protein